jgi:hypothetical protein
MVAALIAIGLVAAVVLPRHSFVSASPRTSPSPDLHSEAAVIAAVKHYYEVEAAARKSGDESLIDTVTDGQGSFASQNFRTFIAEQAARGKRSVVLHTYFSDWRVTLDVNTATAVYTSWIRGHDIDARSGAALESDVQTSKGVYRMTLHLSRGAWRVVERDLLKDNVA